MPLIDLHNVRNMLPYSKYNWILTVSGILNKQCELITSVAFLCVSLQEVNPNARLLEVNLMHAAINYSRRGKLAGSRFHKIHFTTMEDWNYWRS